MWRIKVFNFKMNCFLRNLHFHIDHLFSNKLTLGDWIDIILFHYTNVYINTLHNIWITLSSWFVHWFSILSNQYFYIKKYSYSPFFKLSKQFIFYAYFKKKIFFRLKRLSTYLNLYYVDISLYSCLLEKTLYMLYYALLCYTIFKSLSARKHFKKMNRIEIIRIVFIV